METGLEFAARNSEQGTSATFVDPDGNGVEVTLDEHVEEALQAGATAGNVGDGRA